MVRDSAELGENLFLIAQKLLQNNRLRQLLVNTGANPFENIVGTEGIINKNILVVPCVDKDSFSDEGKIVIIFSNGDVDNNNEYKNITISIQIYTPFSTWVINDESLRPFLIMSEIEKVLKNKRINGIGSLFLDNFRLKLVTDKLSCYEQTYTINVFN